MLRSPRRSKGLTPACVIVSVRLSKALKDPHGALKEAKQRAIRFY